MYELQCRRIFFGDAVDDHSRTSESIEHRGRKVGESRMGRFDKFRQALRRQRMVDQDDKETGELNRGERMTTTTAVDKEKVEKRRALGRGLESLLPGPRAVTAPPAPGSATPGKPPVPHVLRNDGHVGEAGEVPGDPVVHGAPAELRPASPGLRPGIPSVEQDIAILAQSESRAHGNLVVNLALSDIDRNPFQTRHVRSDNALLELAESIKANGVVQPILVRPAEDDRRYILILGERRMHASKLAGKTTIPAIVRRVSQQQAAEMTIIENLQREDLSPLEQAGAFRVLSEEFKLTQAQIGERVGLSRESVANYMRLLRLPQPVQELLTEKKINFAEAKELLKLQNEDQITKAALLAVEKGMNFEQVEKLVLQMSGLVDVPGMPGQERKPSGARWVDPNVRAAQMELERLLGVRVKIRDRKGKGKIVIEYHTVNDYERVVGMLSGKK
jgi:ParB family chromosome partitioning protein